MNTPVVDVLLLAKDQIAESEHWCQGIDRHVTRTIKQTPITAMVVRETESVADFLAMYSIEEVVSFCVRGAIREAAREVNAWYRPALLAFARAIVRNPEVPCGDCTAEAAVIGWNDFPRRTHQEVLDAFDRAISIAKES